MSGRRLDRFGEPVDDAVADDAPEHDQVCRDGWLGTDADGHPIPCLRCRPHLAHGPVTVRYRQIL